MSAFKFAVGTNEVPRNALRFAVPCEFGSNGDSAKTVPVKMVARSGDPIEHWYWGDVIHDLSGMRLDKPKVPIDYCHDSDQILGYLNKFDTSSGDLVCSGAVTPFGNGDRASEVVYKQKAGVPYEASINFGGDGIKIEQIAPGQMTQVNGQTFEGPGIVIREWPLRGVAICPYGADSDTSTEFAEPDSPTVSVTLFTKENDMTKIEKPAEASTPAAVEADKTKLTNEAGKPAVELAKDKPAEGATPPVEAKPDHAAFITAFGDTGARWFLEGRSFADATTEFVAAQKKQHEDVVTALKADHKKEVDALNERVTELSGRLDAVKLGNDAVKFQNADNEKKEASKTGVDEPKKFTGLSDNLAKVAAATRMPDAKSGEGK